MVRWGILGPGRVVRRRLASFRTVQRIGSRSVARAAELAAQCGAAAGDYKSVIADPAVDAIYIALPDALHVEWADRALSAGKHVLVEKTACGSAAEAERLIGRGPLIAEAFAYCHHPQYALIRPSATPLAFNSEFSTPVPPADDFRLDPALGEGVFSDAFCYPLHAARRLLAEEPVSARAVGRRSSAGAWISVSALVSFPSADALLSATWNTGFRARLEMRSAQSAVVLPKAFAVQRNETVIVEREVDGAIERHTHAPFDTATRMVEVFEAAVASGERAGFERDLLLQARAMDLVRAALGTDRAHR